MDLLTYASRGPLGADPDRWRALDGFRHRTAPAWTAPRRTASGPSLGKPLADLGLAHALNDALASKESHDASYDAILTHHIEACVIATLLRRARRGGCPPIVYCVHTLLAHELSAYSKSLKNRMPGSEPGRTMRRVKRVIDDCGARADGWAARRADGWIALTQEASRVMRRHSTRPGARIAPPVPDPRRRLDRADPAAVARTLGLEPGGFLLYSGNLDAYQELDLLAAAAAAVPEPERLPIVLATHAPTPQPSRAPAGCRLVSVPQASRMRGLLEAARATVVARRAPGGFPIKLANSLAAGTPPVVFLEREWGLRDGVDAVVAAPGEPVAELARALGRIGRAGEDELARLAAGARSRWEAAHRPAAVAERTLELVDAVVRAAGRPAGPET